MSKLSTTLNSLAYSGVCFGRSVALPPHIISTSTSSACAAASSALYTGVPFVRMLTSSGFLRENTAVSSMSGFCLMAHSTPRPRLPYPMIPILIVIYVFLSESRRPLKVPGFLVILNGIQRNCQSVRVSLLPSGGQRRVTAGQISDQCQANVRQMQNAETAWRQFTIIILQKHAELYISEYTFSVWIVYVLCIGFVCSLGPPGLAPALLRPTWARPRLVITNFFSPPQKTLKF